jgi:putative sterol carrier protein
MGVEIGFARLRANPAISTPVRPEPVEGLSFVFGRKEGQCFDKLSTNGKGVCLNLKAPVARRDAKRRTAMTKSELVAKMQDAGAWLPGKTVKIDFGDEGAILLDGANSLVSENDGAADTTIKVSWDDWQALSSGQLDGMTAFMTGKLKVEGDMSNAMQLQSVLGKLRG